MKIVEPSHKIMNITTNYLKLIESAGRTCYKSEGTATLGSAPAFVKKIIKSGHHSVLEHASMTVRFITDRGVTHELVRHRLCAFSQESTRYCNYSNDKFGKEITVIRPLFWSEASDQYGSWRQSCEAAEAEYFWLVNHGSKPQEARSVLPNSLKTEIVVTANFREWRHIFSLRTASAAHPQMRQIMIPLLNEAQDLVPVVFDEIRPTSI